MLPERESRLRQLYALLTALTDGQLGWIETVASQFQKPANFQRFAGSNLINACILQDFGDALRIHHCFSKEPFSKDKFEYAFERVLNLCGIPAMLAPRGNPGHDITINDIRFSLKTQANKRIAVGHLHISKFMELGRGTWADQDEDLIGLRAQFLRHMESYDRILSLRRLPATATYTWRYELVEIPKSLLQEAGTGTLRMIHRQHRNPQNRGIAMLSMHLGNRNFNYILMAGPSENCRLKG
jgi:Type II site-specific deoxyribonuclease